MDSVNTAGGNSVTGSGRTGETLAAARLAAGLELADIARETRVPARHLAAIEADKHDGLPALPYAIGFVRSFARAVKLDPEVLAAQFRAETSKTAHVPSSIAMEPLDERRMPSRGLVLASIVAVVAIIGLLSAWGSGVFDTKPPAAPAAEVAAAPAPGTAAAPQDGAAATDGGSPAALPAAAAAIPVAGANAPVAGVAAGGAVVLTAKEDVWIKVYDSATRTSARIGVLKTGESYAVPSQPGLLLWTGKAGALAVTVGGRAIPPLGGPVQTVRDLSLAPSDLLARAAAPAAAPGAVP